jgi:hypothetical protein
MALLFHIIWNLQNSETILFQNSLSRLFLLLSLPSHLLPYQKVTLTTALPKCHRCYKTQTSPSQMLSKTVCLPHRVSALFVLHLFLTSCKNLAVWCDSRAALLSKNVWSLESSQAWVVRTRLLNWCKQGRAYLLGYLPFKSAHVSGTSGTLCFVLLLFPPSAAVYPKEPA